jgi:hypothetical protein
MTSSTARRRVLAIPVALLLSLLLASQAMAATWSTPIPLTSSGSASSGGLVALGSSTAVAVYVENSDFFNVPSAILTRRSTNSGASWSSPSLLTSDGVFPAIAGRGANVDIVYNKSNGRVRYARSTNGGASFGSSIAISPAGRFAWRPSVARGPNGRVAVVWEDVVSGAVNVRVSKNGGASFGSAKVLTTAGGEMGTAVAIGKGVIYVAYSVGSESLRVRRSRDSGATWSAAQVITNSMWLDGISMTAAGSHAYVAFTGPNSGPNFSKVRYRRTTNKGASWSSQMDLGPANRTTYSPHLSLKGGVLRAAFVRCLPEWDICGSERVLYRQSSNGTSWTTSERVSTNSVWDAWDPSVGFAGRILVLYTGEGPDGQNIHVRRGTP